MSPYEVGMYKYGTYLTPDALANKYFCGASVDDNPEPPLHFIQGKAVFIFVSQLARQPDS